MHCKFFGSESWMVRMVIFNSFLKNTKNKDSVRKVWIIALSFYNFSLRALVTTETELRLIAAAAIMGLRRIEPNAYNTPAAIGMPREL